MKEIVDKMTAYTYPNGTAYYTDPEIVDEICGLALQNNFCRLSAKSKKKFEWTISIPEKAPKCKQKSDGCKKETRNSFTGFRALHVTDVHIQFDYAANSSSICDQPMCCRESQEYPQSPSDIPAGSQFGLCDTPHAILPSFCADAKARGLVNEIRLNIFFLPTFSIETLFSMNSTM